MEQLKIYEIPEMEFILVDNGDVIVTSGLGGGFDVTDPWADEDQVPGWVK